MKKESNNNQNDVFSDILVKENKLAVSEVITILHNIRLKIYKK